MSANFYRRHVGLSVPTDREADDESIDDLDAAICTLASGLNSQTCRLLALVRRFDDRMGWAKWSFRNCAEWLAWRCGVSLSAAREKVRTAQALRDLPAIAAAFADGRLSYTKVRALTRVAAANDADALLGYALRSTAPQVEERCRQLRNAEPESVNGARRAWERRSLTLWRDTARNVMAIRVEVPLEEGELVAQALERAVAAGEAAMGIEFAEDPIAETEESASNGWRAQQADALVAMAKAYLGGREPSAEGSPVACADHCQVVVHVDDSALRGGRGRSDAPIDTVKRLTCDGSLVTVVEDEDGTPLDVGRKQRTVSTLLRRALWARDRGCSFPGCCNKRFVDAHHLRHWANGGETVLDNLTLLCSHHHRLLHEGGFTIHRDEHGERSFRRRDGRVIPRFGYRLEDMRDDDGEPSAEGFGATHEREGNPSAEVREERGVYVVAPCNCFAKFEKRVTFAACGEGARAPF